MKVVERSASVKSITGSRQRPDEKKKRAAEVVNRLRQIENSPDDERLTALWNAVIELAALV